LFPCKPFTAKTQSKRSVFAVTGAGLSELNASPFALPKGATPFGIVVT